MVGRYTMSVRFEDSLKLYAHIVRKAIVCVPNVVTTVRRVGSDFPNLSFGDDIY